MRTLLLIPLLAASACTSFTSVDEACKETVPGEKWLEADEVPVFLRINCHRRLVGLAQGQAGELIEQQSRDVASYVAQNPDSVLYGGWTNQDPLAPGFTGTTVFERMETLGYYWAFESGWGVQEYLLIEDKTTPPDVLVDEQMRYGETREHFLMPNWVDGGYARAALTPEWWIALGFDPLLAPTEGYVHYFVVFHESPQTEHAESPILYPKDGQVDVPLYSHAIDFGPGVLTTATTPTTTTTTGNPSTTNTTQPPEPPSSRYPYAYKAGFPISIATTSLLNDPTITIDGATLFGPNNIVAPTEIVHPGDFAPEYYLDELDITAVIIPRFPLEPQTTYEFFLQGSNADGPIEIESTFTTASDDLGLTSATSALRSAEPIRRRERSVRHPAPTPSAVDALAP